MLLLLLLQLQAVVSYSRRNVVVFDCASGPTGSVTANPSPGQPRPTVAKTEALAHRHRGPQPPLPSSIPPPEEPLYEETAEIEKHVHRAKQAVERPQGNHQPAATFTPGKYPASAAGDVEPLYEHIEDPPLCSSKGSPPPTPRETGSGSGAAGTGRLSTADVPKTIALDAVSTAGKVVSPVMAKSSRVAPAKRESQPGLPVPRPTQNGASEGQDERSAAGGEKCDDVYVARWDCEAGAPNELSFHYGDQIVIISRQYDEFGWWIGQLIVGESGHNSGDGASHQQLIGLVPKDYLQKSQ